MLPTIVANQFKRMDLASESITPRCNKSARISETARVAAKDFDNQVRSFERAPETRIALADIKLSLGAGRWMALPLPEFASKVQSGSGEACSFALRLGWKGLLGNEPAVKLHLCDGYSQGYEGTVGIHGRIAKRWITALSECGPLPTAETLSELLAEHRIAARYYGIAFAENFDTELQVEATKRLASRTGFIAREYLHKLFLSRDSTVVATAINGLNDDERADASVFSDLLHAMRINAGTTPVLGEGLRKMTVEPSQMDFALNSGRCAAFSSQFRETKKHADDFVRSLIVEHVQNLAPTYKSPWGTLLTSS